MKRGDLVTVALSGDYGKPRPALIVQSDAFQFHPSVTLLPLTSDTSDASLVRVTVFPEKGTGLNKLSQVMIDKAATLSRLKVGRRIGSVNALTLRAVEAALLRFLGLGPEEQGLQDSF